LEEAEASEVVKGVNLAARIPIEALRKIEPERAAGRRIEVPRDDFPDPGV
jgi:hypothetical protein